MLRLLDRYLGREVLTSALFAVGTLSLVLVLGQIFKKLFEFVIDHNVPATFIVTFIAYFLPLSLTFSIPWGLLTAVLLVFGRLSAGNELTALRTAGLSIGRIARPVFALAIIFSLVCLYINLYVAPRAQQNLKDAFFQVATNNPAAAFSGDTVITDFPGRKIYVGANTGNQLENIHVFELNQAQQPVRVVYARRGRLEVDLTDPKDKKIKMRLENSRYEQRDAAAPADLTKIHDGITMGAFVFPISLEELYAKKQKRRRVETLTYGELRTEIVKVGDDLARAHAKVKQDAADQAPAATRAESKKAENSAVAARASTMTEYNKRFSFSLACLTFTLIGIPLGITAQRQETSIGFGLSLLVAFTYFLIIIVVNTFREKAGVHPELLIWLPNVIFLLLGGVLFYRLSRR